MHRALWKLPPARKNAKPKTVPVAVKVQYPGAGEALLADLKQLSRLAGMFKIIQPGMDVKPLLAELRARITEELDYAHGGGDPAGLRRRRTRTTRRSSCPG